jgi:hypothetical protein
MIASRLSSARRSRFCEVTYSTACQRVTRLTRLPTLALPAIAPISASSNQRASRAMVSGSNSVSASSAMTMSPLAISSPWLSARALPPFSSVSSWTRGSLANAARTNLAGAVLRSIVEHDHFDMHLLAGEHAADRFSITFASL